MASNVITRKADEQLRNIALIGKVSHQIVGAKLPSNRQILQVFFYNMRYVKLDAKQSAQLTVDAALIFWHQARIPTRNPDKCANKLIKIYEEWKCYQKSNVNKFSAKRKQEYEDFIENLDNIFDMAHAEAMTMMRNEEDKEFLLKQREKGRPGSMIGIDQKLDAKEKRSQLRKEQEEARKMRHAESQASTSTSTMQNGKTFFYKN